MYCIDALLFIKMLYMSVQSNIGKGAIISYVSIFLNIVISFFYTPWMINKIGMSDYGLYSLSVSFIGYFILDFGMSSSITRFIAKYRAEGRQDKVENMLGLTTRIYLTIDIVIFIILFISYFFVSGIFVGLTPEELLRFKKLYIIAGTFSILSFVFKPMGGAMMAYELFVENKLLDMVTRVGTVLLIMLFLLLDGDVFTLVLVNGIVGLCVNIAKFTIFSKKTHVHINFRFFEKDELKILFSFSMWIFLANLAQRFRFTLNQSVLGIMSNSTEISLYSMGMSLEGLVWTMSAALNGLFLPKVTRMSCQCSRNEIMDLMIRVGRIQLFIFSLIFSGFCIFGRQFINLWVGETFHDVYFILIFFIVSHFFTLTQQIALDLVVAENRVKVYALCIFVCSALGLAGSVLTSKHYGAMGSAFCTGLSLCLYVIMINIYYQKGMKLDMVRFFKSCHLKIVPIIAILSIVSFVIVSKFSLNSWLKLVLAIAIYGIVYALISFFCLFNQDEKNLIKGIVKK